MRCVVLKTGTNRRPAGWMRSVVAVLSVMFATGAAQAADVTGLWYDDSGRGAVEIKRCGASLCGNIRWLREPLRSDGRPFVDALNPDQSKRRRRICGLQVIGDLQQMGDGSWDGGWIYDPKTGKSYRVAVSLKSRNQLSVLGYLGIKMLGRELIWRRAPADLGSCETT